MLDITDDIMSKPTEESRVKKYNYCKENHILFATGSNWDLFAVMSHGKIHLYSIAKPGSGASNSYFGDIEHVKNLIRKGYWRDQLTDIGQDILKSN